MSSRSDPGAVLGQFGKAETSRTSLQEGLGLGGGGAAMGPPACGTGPAPGLGILHHGCKAGRLSCAAGRSLFLPKPQNRLAT